MFSRANQLLLVAQYPLKTFELLLKHLFGETFHPTYSLGHRLRQTPVQHR